MMKNYVFVESSTDNFGHKHLFRDDESLFFATAFHALQSFLFFEASIFYSVETTYGIKLILLFVYGCIKNVETRYLK